MEDMNADEKAKGVDGSYHEEVLLSTKHEEIRDANILRKVAIHAKLHGGANTDERLNMQWVIFGKMIMVMLFPNESVLWK